MILSAAMMLDWLGIKHDNQTMVAHGALLRDAVYETASRGTDLTRDLGGKASTREAADAVLDVMMVNA
jgi:3-isopropylmalate dehydrogenase